jgi:hypothetical protein
MRLHVRLTGVYYLALEYAAPAKDFDEISSSENLPRVDSEEIVSAIENNKYHA